MVPVFAKLFHISGDGKGSKGGNVHVLLGDIKQNAVVLDDDSDFIRVNKNSQLAENGFIPVLFQFGL